MTVLVVTANVGGRDELHPAVYPQEDVDVHWRYWCEEYPHVLPEPWPWVPRLIDRAAGHPNLTAKWYKTHPDPEYAATIWVDSSMEITSTTFVRDALETLWSSGAPVAACAHPRRDCIYDEAAASVGAEGLGRYDPVRLREQVTAYAAEGHPQHWGLWACGILAWDGSREARTFGEAWWQECVRWSIQDQLSFPAVARRLGYRPGTFPVPLIERATRKGLVNRWLTIHPHTPGSDSPHVESPDAEAQ